MITIKEENIAEQLIYTMVNDENTASFSVIASKGAALFRLKLCDKSIAHSIFKNHESPENFIARYSSSFSGSQLFPFPNRIAAGQYSLENKQYQFVHNDFGRPNALHGHIFNKAFTLESFDRSRSELHLSHDYQGDDPAYPFPYAMKNIFKLEENKLSIITTIKNNSDLRLPYGFGWHPYFYAANGINKYKLVLATHKQMELNELLIPTGKFLEYEHFQRPELIANSNFDTCFLRSSSEPIKLFPDELNACIELGVSDFDFLQVYIPPSRDSIALEPQSCAPDAFNNGIGLKFIPPGIEVSYCFDIKLVMNPNY